MHYGYGYFEEDHLGELRDMRLWRRIAEFIVPYWKWVVLAIVLSLAISASSLALPYLLRMGVDQYIVRTELEPAVRFAGLTRLALVFAAMMLLGFGANFLQVVVLERTGQRIMHAMRQRLMAHVLDLNLAFYDSHPVGKLVTRLTNDIQNMHEMFTSVIVTVFNDLIVMAGVMVVLLHMDWRLTLVLGLVVPFIAILTLTFSRMARDVFRTMRTHLARINAFLQEALSGISTIQLLLQETEAYRRFTDINKDFYLTAHRQIRVFALFIPLLEFTSAVTGAVIIWYGGGEIIREHMTLGVLVAFLSYMRLFFQPLRELSQKYSLVQSAMASAERVFQLLDSRDILPVAVQSLNPDSPSGSIEFRGVTFGYEPGQATLKELSFRVEPGETLAIVGATGSGKTTVINLLERFYDPEQGQVCLDGIDLRRLDIGWLRRQVGLVMQDVFIIPGTLRNNIVLDQKPSEKELGHIIDLAQLSSLIEQLPAGLETRIGEGGMDLSSGQRQLLAIARVLARNPRILVLDEATASVDTETEMLVEQAVQAALSNRTSIVIAHRLSTIRRAHRILVMDRGRIVEQGTHESLLAQGGHYSCLHALGTLSGNDLRT